MILNGPDYPQKLPLPVGDVDHIKYMVPWAWTT